MNDYKTNQRERLLAIVNRPLATRTKKGSDKLTETSIEKNRIRTEAHLLLGQAETAGGWNILKNEIANFLYRAE